MTRIRDEFDWDDDNDGILEGPIDYSQGNDPNVTSDRHVEPTTIHPWTGQAVGFNYSGDQNPMDHDNDGITDEDVDGSGRGSYDEDDDNDGRIDQFVWPCDFDSDGIQDYFDDDDDNDGVADISDIHPWDPQNSSIETATGILWDSWVRWTQRITATMSMVSTMSLFMPWSTLGSRPSLKSWMGIWMEMESLTS